MSATELLEPVLKGGIRSINFFNGRLLSAEDLTDEQNANRQGRALVAQAVGEGIAYGLEVAKSAAGTSQESVVTVAAGLAFNRRGQALKLPTPTDVALSRQTSAAATAASAFKPCVELQGGVFITDAGIYLLTIAPAEGREGRAPSSGLGNTSAPCAARYAVEGVQFRLVQLLKSTELGEAATLRNRVAYQCFGAETLRQFESAPFGQPPKRYGLLDALRPNTLTDFDVPLALVYWTKQGGVEFVDLWSVRRRPARPSVTERWGALADDRRVAEAEAMMLQFQEQVAALQTGASLSGLRAEDRFAYLPPAGLLPVGAQGVTWQTFLGPHAPPEATNIDEGLLRSILARSVFVDPIKLSSFASPQVAGQSPPAPVGVYRIPANNDFVLFARSTRGRLRVFLGSANANVPVGQIFAESSRSNTRHFAAGGAGGIYVIDRLDAGAYNVSVNVDGFPETPAAASVTAGRTTDVPFTAGAPGSILVTIKDKATGASVGNKVQSVTATRTGGAPAQGVAAGDKWHVPNLVAGAYSVNVTATGYQPKTASGVAVALGQVANLTIELDAVPSNDAVINLEVSDKATTLRIDAAVQSVKATNVATGAVKQGAKSGGAAPTWSVSQLAAGTYAVEVTATNYQKETASNVQLTAGQTKALPVQMTPTPGSIALTITNSTTGASLNDKVTNVTATSGQQSFNGTKDGDGKWSVANLPPGTYSVTVTATGFQTKTESNVAVAAAQAKPLAVVMQPVQAAPGAINLTITNSVTGAALGDEVTNVTATSGNVIFSGTKKDGKWSITSLAPGTYAVEVMATNYNTKTVSGVEVLTGQVKALPVALQPLPGSVKLAVTDSQTGGAIDNKVTGVTATGPQTVNGSKGGDGKWTVGNLTPGTYSVAVTATNYKSKTSSGVVVEAGQVKNLPVSLQPEPGSIALNVNVTGTGSAIDDRVTNVTATNGQQSFNGVQGGNGKWSISNLPPGTYSVTVSAARYDSKTTNGVQVSSASATPLTVALAPEINMPSTSIFFTRGNLDHQHTEHTHVISATAFAGTPPTGALNTPDVETRPWLASWRKWFALTRPEKGIDETKDPAIKVTSTGSVGDQTVESNGFAVFFRADNTRVAVTWEKRVKTIFPGTEPQ